VKKHHFGFCTGSFYRRVEVEERCGGVWWNEWCGGGLVRNHREPHKSQGKRTDFRSNNKSQTSDIIMAKLKKKKKEADNVG
jgi:hypothetical protein